jgi:hypothetical protein
MMKSEQIERILRTNGLDPSAPDEEIRSVLLSARFREEEVDAAIMVLRENTSTHTSRVDGLHRVFRRDEALKPAQITDLLGIEVDLRDEVIPQSKEVKVSPWQYVSIVLSGVIVAGLGLGMYMYLHEIGPFHHSATFAK